MGITTFDNQQAVNQTDTFDFTKEQDAYKVLIADWIDEDKKVTKRREIRRNRRNVDEEQQKGTILKDETIIPDRTVDTNIRQCRSPYVSYVTQARKPLIVTEIGKPDLSVEPLELWFARGMHYPEWKYPWIKLADAMLMHGGATMEVIYDTDLPLHVGFEYIPRDRLLFDPKCEGLQGQPRLLRKYVWTLMELEEYGEEYGFDPDAIKFLISNQTKTKKPVDVYKVFCKKKGVVYIAWYCRDYDKNWLKPPEPHNIGLMDFDPKVVSQLEGGVPLFMSDQWTQQPPEPTPSMMEADDPGMMHSPQGQAMMAQMAGMAGQIAPQIAQMVPLSVQFAKPLLLRRYPLIWFPYELTEDAVLLESQGRVALDVHEQEALTHLLTNTVNATRRASQFFPYRKNDPTHDVNAAEMQTLEHGVVFPFEMGVFQPTWPQPIILAVQQAMRTNKAQETGNTDYAAVARKDANKTATELEMAQNKSQMNVTTEMDIYSSPVLDAYALAFLIAEHQAVFNQVERPTHPELLLGNYNLVPGGYVEVVKREEDKQNAKEFFNIVKGTPAAEKILTFLIKRFFPDQADEWIAAISGPDKDGIIIQLINMLQGVMNDLGPSLPPDQRAALTNIIAAASSVVAPRNDSTISPSPGGGVTANPGGVAGPQTNPGQHPNNSAAA